MACQSEQPALLAGQVDGGQCADRRQPGCVRLDREYRRSVVGVGQHVDPSGDRARRARRSWRRSATSRHRSRLRARGLEPIRDDRADRPRRTPPCDQLARERCGAAHRPARPCRPKRPAAAGASTAVDKYGRAQQRAAHLLHDDAHLDVAGAGAAERLGYARPSRPISASSGPDRRVVAGVGGHQPAHLGLGGPLGQQVDHRLGAGRAVRCSALDRLSPPRLERRLSH